MGKIITIWGNPGSGKSMFACNLAKVLTAGKKKALIINADSSTPMLPVWMPDRILETSASVGNVLTALEINNALIAERVVVLKEYPFIGVLGYAAGENPFSYPELKYEKIKIFISECAKLVDYILIDCPPQLSILTINALACADSVLIPVKTDYLAYRGLEQLLETVSEIRELVNPQLSVLGIIATMYETRVKDDREILQLLQERYSVIATVKRLAAVKKGVCDGKAVTEQLPANDAAAQYERVAAFVMEGR